MTTGHATPNALVFPCHPNRTILYPEKPKISYGSISSAIKILLRKNRGM